jgi:hypothetical protein
MRYTQYALQYPRRTNHVARISNVSGYKKPDIPVECFYFELVRLELMLATSAYVYIYLREDQLIRRLVKGITAEIVA